MYGEKFIGFVPERPPKLSGCAAPAVPVRGSGDRKRYGKTVPVTGSERMGRAGAMRA